MVLGQLVVALACLLLLTLVKVTEQEPGGVTSHTSQMLVKKSVKCSSRLHR